MERQRPSIAGQGEGQLLVPKLGIVEGVAHGPHSGLYGFGAKVRGCPVLIMRQKLSDQRIGVFLKKLGTVCVVLRDPLVPDHFGVMLRGDFQGLPANLSIHPVLPVVRLSPSHKCAVCNSHWGMVAKSSVLPTQKQKAQELIYINPWALVLYMVELNGLEPSTSCLPDRRSPS